MLAGRATEPAATSTTPEVALAEPPKDYLPEIVIGFVAPTGIQSAEVKSVVISKLKKYHYDAAEVHISEQLAPHCLTGEETPLTRIERLQTAGNEIRRTADTSAALAQLAILAIKSERTKWQEDSHIEENKPHPRCAYLVWSLKTPDEIELLRLIYGSRFFLMSLFSPRTRRIDVLASLTSRASRGRRQPNECRPDAEKVVDRDQQEKEEKEEKFGQQVRKAYPLADFFIDASDSTRLGQSIERAIDVIFGGPFETPTIDEFAMAAANVAALQSAEPGRQVGAVILSVKGDIVASGSNEVPVFDGGHFWPEPMKLDHAAKDNREFYLYDDDTADREKQRLAEQVWTALAAKDGTPRPTPREIYESLKETGLDSLTEFGRAVHGEMNALMDAARQGIGVAGLTMYVTTFPCHQCTRHIIAAGIHRLVYVYPYAKSRAQDLHGDSIELEARSGDKVTYESFLGVSPRAYSWAFAMPKRKNDTTGQMEPIADEYRVPRLPEGREKGKWDSLGYLLLGEKIVNQACDVWRANAFAEVEALMLPNIDASAQPPITTSDSPPKADQTGGAK
jgi:deoxycytidylate deaminase